MRETSLMRTRVRFDRSVASVLTSIVLVFAGCRETQTLGGGVAGSGTAANAAMGAGTSATVPATTKIDRSALGDVGTDKPLDYADPRLWLCRPGNDPDECDANIDATELLPNGTMTLIKHEKAANPEFDCFYVYPTVKLTSAGPMTDFSNIDITLDPLLSHAARFNQMCRVFAPLYRQTGVVPGAGGAPTLGGSFDLGLSDVRDAFKYYVEHLNNGRKFVLMGHSQGTGMVTAMMAQDVDNTPDVRAKLISAVLLGGSIAVPTGAAVGGTFKNIPVCTAPSQVGCIVTYMSYSAELPPSATSTFGKAPAAGQMSACTEPAMLAGHAGQNYKGSYIRMNRVNKTFDPQGIELLPAGITTPFVVYRDVLKGDCRTPDGFSYLEISLHMPAGDLRPPPPYRFPAIEAALGLHIVDYNLEMDDLLETVRLQAAAALGTAGAATGAIAH
jgi:pimeloyl-ACP methyl ester carboxylesterase